MAEGWSAFVHAAGLAKQRKLSSPFEAMLLHPVVVLVVAACVGAAVFGYFVDRQVTYESEATLMVGRIDVPANAVPGYTAANNTLAGSYSRIVGTDAHMDTMAGLAGLTRVDVQRAGDVWGSNVPETPIIRLRAAGPNEGQAEQLADLAALALTQLVAQINDADVEGISILAEHAEASESLAASQADLEKLQRDLAFFLGAGDTVNSDAVQAELDRTRADFEQQQLRVNTLAGLYQENQQYRIEGDLVRVLSGAAITGNSAQSSVQLGVVAGIALGLGAGVALAWFFTNIGPLVNLRSDVVGRHRAAQGDHDGRPRRVGKIGRRRRTPPAAPELAPPEPVPANGDSVATMDR